MTARLVIGIDPGKSGALVALADGVLDGVLDMPLEVSKISDRNQVDARALAKWLRAAQVMNSGAYVVAVLEKVGGFRGQGGSSMFAFGQSDGIVRGVLGALGIDLVEVKPQLWKAFFHLSKTEKDVAREFALQVVEPQAAHYFARVKDGGRADAYLLARWAEENECAAPRKVIREGLFRGCEA